MADRLSGGFRWLLGLMLTPLAPVVVELLGWNEPWLVIVPSALIGALCLWNINAAYGRWVNERDRWEVTSWLSSHLTLAGLGIAVVGVAALLMAWSSTENIQAGIAYALGLWLAGTVPVVQVVRAKLADIADAVPFVVAWGLNALLIAGATVLPAGLLTGWERSGVVLGAVAGGVWLFFEVARRLIGVWPWLVGVGAFCLLLPVGFVLFADADRVRWPILLLFPVGLALVSARQRSDRPVLMAAPQRATDPWKVTALAGLLLLLVGFAWWVIVVGDDVSRALVFAGVFGAVLFGASLVTRGEGLVVVVLIGLLMVWVVQDHTGDPAPVAAITSDAVLAAFGDSYLSGEGIGSFYAGTNTAGAEDLAIDGINECRRSEHAYSPAVAADQGLDLAFYGCSGALAVTGRFDETDPESVAEEFAANSVYGQLLRWEAERGTDNDPELVLLSMGGNDALFAKIGAACFLPGSCDNALDTSATPALTGVTTRVEIALTKARTLFPTSPMVVVAYPQMFGPAVDECAGQVPFNASETVALRDFVDALNGAIGAGIENAGSGQVVHFTGAAAAYDGERFCERDSSGELVEPTAIRALAFQPTEGDDLLDRLGPAKIIHNTFHPTRRGHELVSAALIEFLEADCHLGADAWSDTARCEAAGAPVAAPAADTAEPSGIAGPVTLESDDVVDDAPVGGCNDLDSFNQCTLIQSLRLVLVPVVLMVLAGLLLVLAARQGDLVEWVRTRLPLARRAIQVTPLRDPTDQS